jgi:hypothetical protein
MITTYEHPTPQAIIPLLERVTTRTSEGYYWDGGWVPAKTLIVLDGVHALTVTGERWGDDLRAVAPVLFHGKQTTAEMTPRMPNYISTHKDAVQWWVDELAFYVEYGVEAAA